jgi:FkbM family methyltransferase
MSDIFSFLKRTVFPLGKTTVFEIGIADGGDTMAIMNAVDPSVFGIDYYAFEPDPRNICTLKRGPLVSMDGFNLVQAAVGGCTMIRDFHLSEGFNPNLKVEHTFSSSLKEPKLHLQDHPWCKFDKTILVKVMRLDDFCRLYSIDRIDFIWCDVQGAEDLVIQGGRVALSNTRYFYTEYYDTELYDGQLPVGEIHGRLPGEWKMIKKWENDVLFENQKFV